MKKDNMYKWTVTYHNPASAGYAAVNSTEVVAEYADYQPDYRCVTFELEDKPIAIFCEVISIVRGDKVNEV